jgi:RNA polymerase sigma-70 factor (ECF subfamily)
MRVVSMPVEDIPQLRLGYFPFRGIFRVTAPPDRTFDRCMEPVVLADSDQGLLRRYADSRDESAFALLVRRHVDLVYSAAVRRVGDRHLAEDVTQAVFVVLARKARSIRDDAPLSAWLLSTVRYCAANALKMEQRRQRHEHEAAVEAHRSGACSSNPTDVLLWQEVARELDDAVLALPAADRSAVLLRYFENRGVADIAASLNVTEGAAKQRLSRAIDKLRQKLTRRGAGGYLASGDSAAMAALLASHAVRAAPPGLVSSALAAATGGAAATGAGISIAKGAMTMMTWAKSKLVAAAIVGVMVVGGTGGVIATRSATAAEKPTAPAAAADAPKADEAPQPDDQSDKPSLASAPPVVVKSIPQAGAMNVDPATTEIRVTYSKNMKDGSWSWSTWGQENFPKMTGKPHYADDKRTCVAPVKLEPNKFYAIWLNSENFGNFKDAGGRPAVPYLLVFKTKAQ